MATFSVTPKPITISMVSSPQMPYRQIRALYDGKTVTVYQAYSTSIATAAVATQSLSASSDFSYNRMTWIKPSWCWMLYRSDYSLKDSRQSRILAITMTHAHFIELLSHACVTDGHAQKLTNEEKKRKVRVQWDPERNVRLGELGYRSLQVGIGREISEKWVKEWISGIEDVTEKALKCKELVEKGKSEAEMVEEGCLWEERDFIVPNELRKILKMDDIGFKKQWRRASPL